MLRGRSVSKCLRFCGLHDRRSQQQLFRVDRRGVSSQDLLKSNGLTVDKVEKKMTYGMVIKLFSCVMYEINALFQTVRFSTRNRYFS